MVEENAIRISQVFGVLKKPPNLALDKCPPGSIIVAMAILSQRLRNQLTHQLDELRAQICEIHGDIAALSDILGVDVAETLPASIKSTRSSRRNGQITFASHVRDALGRIGQPARAKEIASVLESNGIRTKGKAKLTTNVASELVRLFERPNSGVKRLATGVYVLDAGEHGNGSGVGKPS